jgi:hypothetical protein
MIKEVCVRIIGGHNRHTSGETDNSLKMHHSMVHFFLARFPGDVFMVKGGCV